MPSASPLIGLRWPPCGDLPTAESMSCEARSGWPGLDGRRPHCRIDGQFPPFNARQTAGTRSSTASLPEARNLPDPATSVLLQPAASVHTPQRRARLARGFVPQREVAVASCRAAGRRSISSSHALPLLRDRRGVRRRRACASASPRPAATLLRPRTSNEPVERKYHACAWMAALFAMHADDQSTDCRVAGARGERIAGPPLPVRAGGQTTLAIEVRTAAALEA
jgi:hypothetical protein